MLRIRTVLLIGVLLAPPQMAFAQQPPAPLEVTADQITYDANRQTVEAVGHVRLHYRGIRLSAEFVLFDLRTEQVTARGQVVITDPRGRTLRGAAVFYDVRQDRAEVEQAETVVDGFTVRADRLVMQGARLLARGAAVTPCDPRRPCLQLTADEVEATPGDRLIARHASLWIGGRRILTLPSYTILLRDGRRTASSFPQAGYNTIDGLWLEYRWAELFGMRDAYALGRAGTLAQRAEVGWEWPNLLAPTAPVALSVGANAGWHREVVSGVTTTRLQYLAGLQTREFVLDPRTTARAALSWQRATYGTADHQEVLRADAAVVHTLGPERTVSLRYDLLAVWGATPLRFDAIATQDLTNRLGLQYAQGGRRGRSIQTSFGVGTAYNFMDATTSVNVSYGERLPEQYHWGLGTEYNLETRTTKLSADLGHSVGYATYFTVQGVYNTGSSRFEDLDFIVTSRLCNCFDVSFKYRQVRQEIWLQVALRPPEQVLPSPEAPAP